MANGKSNPFWRLKHYLPDKIDPQENHATECLAACLVFSARIRTAFIRFLLGDDNSEVYSSGTEVITQLSIESDNGSTGGYIDLVLQNDTKFVIAVEVKVKAREDGEQIRKYSEWLDKQHTDETYLFTLVRNADKAFQPEQYGANGRRTWRALHKYFQEVLKEDDLSEVEQSLITNFCDYLESEAIVSTYQTKDLLSYAVGLKAREAVTGIFSQIASRLEADEFAAISVEGRKNHWPQLRIQHPEWEKIFGKGQNWKIALWFSIPGIWKAEHYELWPEIELWHKDHGNDWQFIKSKLPVWLNKLKSEKYQWSVFQTWEKAHDNISWEEIWFEPKKIVASKDGTSIALNQESPQSEDVLVDSLVKWAKEYSAVVESLKM